jgi:hypothetical protein
VIHPTTIKVFLEEIGGPTAPDVELAATAASGIVAVDDGGTWGASRGWCCLILSGARLKHK